MNLTAKEIHTLQYLSNRMEASARMIGEELFRLEITKSKNALAVGASVCGNLHKKELVLYLPDLKAWRISKLGRQTFFRSVDKTVNHS